MNENVSISAIVLARQGFKTIKGIDNIDDLDNIQFINIQKSGENLCTKTKGAVFSLTRSASTLSRAKKYLYEDLEQITFDGIKYRKDISSYVEV